MVCKREEFLCQIQILCMFIINMDVVDANQSPAQFLFKNKRYNIISTVGRDKMIMHILFGLVPKSINTCFTNVTRVHFL